VLLIEDCRLQEVAICSNSAMQQCHSITIAAIVNVVLSIVLPNNNDYDSSKHCLVKSQNACLQATYFTVLSRDAFKVMEGYISSLESM